ncbi:hypothetical protein [Crossiella sp. NPDC003009]
MRRNVVLVRHKVDARSPVLDSGLSSGRTRRRLGIHESVQDLGEELLIHRRDRGIGGGMVCVVAGLEGLGDEGLAE